MGILWGLLGLGSALFFRFNRNASLKRRLWPTVHIIEGFLFMVVCWFGTGMHQPEMYWFMVPAVALISFLNIRSARFCDSCGRTLYRQNALSRLPDCPHCGACLPSK